MKLPRWPSDPDLSPGFLSSSTSSSAFLAISRGLAILGEIFASVVVFLSNLRGSHIPSSWMVHGRCVLLPAFTRLGHECQDLLSVCDRMHVCTDYN